MVSGRARVCVGVPKKKVCHPRLNFLNDERGKFRKNVKIVFYYTSDLDLKRSLSLGVSAPKYCVKGQVQWMSDYQTGLVFRLLALVPFQDGLDFRRCLKSEIENSEPNTVYSYKSNWTGRVWFIWSNICLKSEFPCVWISGVVWIAVVWYSDVNCILIDVWEKKLSCKIMLSLKGLKWEKE